MDFKTWCKTQAEEAKKHKWNKGVELGKDPGEQAIVDWVNKHAESYRVEYNQCMLNISQQVFNKVKNNEYAIDNELLLKITNEVIEEFTKIWVKEVAKETKHVTEI